MKKVIIFCYLMTLFPFSSFLLAQGLNPVAYTRNMNSSRAYALGGALVADSWDENTGNYNFAAMTQLDFAAVNYFYSIIPNGLKYNFMNGVIPLNIFSPKIPYNAVIGINGSFMALREIALYDNYGNLSDYTASDIQYNIGLSYGMFFFKRFGVGLRLNYFRHSLFEKDNDKGFDYAANGFGVDLSLFFKTIFVRNLDAGFTVKNVYGKVFWDTESSRGENIPVNFDVGLSFFIEKIGLRFVNSFEYEWGDTFLVKGGIEYILLRHIIFRGGLNSNLNFSVGGGLNYYVGPVKLNLDYAYYRERTGFFNNHQISFSVHFIPRNLTKAKEFRFKGEEFFRAASYGKALDFWEQSLDYNRSDDNLYFRIRKLKSYKGNIDDIASYFFKDIDLSNLYYEKGLKSIEQKKYKKAIENAKLALLYNIKNKNAEMLMLYAESKIKYDNKEYIAAQKLIDRLIKINPLYLNAVDMKKEIASMDYHEKQLFKVKELMNSGNFIIAQKELKDFLARFPDDKEGMELKNEIDQGANKIEAERIYAEALKLFNDEQYENATKMTEAGLIKDPENTNLLSLKKEIEAKYGHIMSQKYFEKASRFIIEKNYAKAKEMLATAKEYEPDNQQIKDLYLKIAYNEKIDRIRIIENEADLLMKNKKYEEAAKKYEEALALDAENEVLKNKANQARRRFMEQKVQKYIESADRLIKEEKYSEAEKVLAEGAKIDPDNREINQRLQRINEIKELLGE